jgi:hypothetical protein
MEATTMKPVGLIGAGVLLLLLGAVAPTYARQEQEAKPLKQEQKAKPERQEQQAKGQQNEQRQQQQQAKVQQDQRRQQQRGEQQQQAKTQQNEQRQQQQQAKVQQDQRRQQQRGEQQQQAKTQQNEQRQQQQQAYRPSKQERGQRQVAWQDHRARDWQFEHRNWQERGGYNGYRIPDDRYRGQFGRDHSFRIYGLPEVVVGGYPRFQYQGFWFSVVDPWPEEWSNNWYDNDDVYVVYTDGGYYLYDRSHPGVGLAVSVYLN